MGTKHLGEIVVQIAQTRRLKKTLKQDLEIRKNSGGDTLHLRTQLKIIKDGIKASKGARDVMLRHLIKEKTSIKRRTSQNRETHQAC